MRILIALALGLMLIIPLAHAASSPELTLYEYPDGSVQPLLTINASCSVDIKAALVITNNSIVEEVSGTAANRWISSLELRKFKVEASGESSGNVLTVNLYIEALNNENSQFVIEIRDTTLEFRGQDLVLNFTLIIKANNTLRSDIRDIANSFRLYFSSPGSGVTVRDSDVSVTDEDGFTVATIRSSLIITDYINNSLALYAPGLNYIVEAKKYGLNLVEFEAYSQYSGEGAAQVYYYARLEGNTTTLASNPRQLYKLDIVRDFLDLAVSLSLSNVENYWDYTIVFRPTGTYEDRSRVVLPTYLGIEVSDCTAKLVGPRVVIEGVSTNKSVGDVLMNSLGLDSCNRKKGSPDKLLIELPDRADSEYSSAAGILRIGDFVLFLVLVGGVLGLAGFLVYKARKL